MKTILVAVLFAAISTFGIVGLTHNPSNVFCSVLAAAFPLWIMIQAARTDNTRRSDNVAGGL